MIDAIGEFCDYPDVDRCRRCVDLGGVHEASRLATTEPADHRRLFADLLGRVRHIVAPSDDTASRLSAAIGLTVTTIPHPVLDANFPEAARTGSDTDIVLLGAIGPHKGSGILLETARRARISHPELRFHVIGYTNIDAELESVGNISITGQYEPAQLPRLLAEANGRFALFLHGWPETFSYTLTEAVANGLIPLVPDIGAPAERVRAAGFGIVFPFPIDARQVLDTIVGLPDRFASGSGDGAPHSFGTSTSIASLAALFGLTEPAARVEQTDLDPLTAAASAVRVGEQPQRRTNRGPSATRQRSG
jgi:glycosyltransferase involved in cell wall biosynthesis